jgi:hypothetical protein
MGWNHPDVYYQSEKFGLTPVAEVDYSDGCYQFDIRAIWRHEDGTLYTMRDGGCSCPSPFEDYTTLESLDRFDLAEIEAEVAAELARDYGDFTDDRAAEFLTKIRGL